jgi:hypothetical protein
MKSLLIAGLLLLAAPAAAQADSIVYIDQGNVWSARPDGSAKVQLTTGGGWHSPTQADDGTVAAVQGTGLSTYGNQFGVSDPEWVTNSNTLVFGGYGSQVSIDDLGPGDYSQKPWMTPDKGDVKTETPPAYPDAACSVAEVRRLTLHR